MRKTLYYFIVITFLCRSLVISAQPAPSVSETLKSEQQKFLGDLRGVSIDSAIVYTLAASFESNMNQLHESVSNDASLQAAEKQKAIWSMVYFVKELDKNIAKQKIEVYDIPGAFQSYKNILLALVHHKPWAPIMKRLGPGRSQLIAAAFNQYKEYPLMDDMAVYKRMTASPEFILQYLENKPGFRFADSLLLEAVANDPLKMVYYLNGNRSGLQGKFRDTRNIYLQQLVSLSQHKQVTELLPFLQQLAEKKITTEEILATRSNIVAYFQSMINTLMAARSSKDSSSIFMKTLRDGVRQKALAFFVNPINDLHSSQDAVRFASVKSLRPEDLYYIITTCGDDLYTSSYLGLYKRLVAQFSAESRDSVFSIVRYDDFHVFMRLAANYNVLADFLSTTPLEETNALIRRFIGGVGNDSGDGLEKAMDIADSFSGIVTAEGINEMVKHELQANLNRCKSRQNFLGMRLYSILLQVYELAGHDVSMNKLWVTLGDYKTLKRSALANKNGEIVQVVLFYGDEDGIASFNNFLKLYTDAAKWEVQKNPNWVSIRSRLDPSVIVYANQPLDVQEELDLRAQDSLYMFLAQQSSEPAILVHRGHSYHLGKTLKRMSPSIKLAILGSCGGFNKAISIASMNPDVQVIGSKKTGAGAINDPIIDLVNETLISGQDLYWPEIWDKLTARFSKSESAISLFNEYLPPSKNIGLFVLKLFMHYNRFSTAVALK